MKSIAFNKSSWHCKLATEWGNLNKWQDVTDICHYTRQVLRGLVLATFAASILSVIAVAVLWMVANMIAAWAFFIFNEGVTVEELHPAGVAGTMMLAIGLVGWLIEHMLKKYRTYAEARRVTRFRETITKDSFVATGWQAWRQKMCMRVSLIDDTAPQERE